jgi:methionyl-tRNA synthetase
MTAALPYANGDIHLGHLVEYIQADIWCRFQKSRGHECIYVCADDAHGTPVMLRAESEGISAEALIKKTRDNHVRDFAAFHIAFDNYYSTHSPENKALASSIFLQLRESGHIAEREIEQLQDAEKGIFLPDRYVRGDCPKCGTAEQYGDSCEHCGAAYAPTELKNPRSSLSNTPPVLKTSKHYFLCLSAMRDELREWTQGDEINPAAPDTRVTRLQKGAANKLMEWLERDLHDWDISRDAPYFGFRIPEVPEEKYFYVWLDAPIGYMASFKNLCARTGMNFDDFWRPGGNTELYHFIGKDILYFHALFWPAVLHHSGYRRPTRIFAHGFLTVNGEKMSKSRGTFITAEHYLNCGLNPEWLRYYYACKLNDRMEDLDLSLNDFNFRVNSDLVGKLVNIPSRVAPFLHKLFDGGLDECDRGGTDFDIMVRPLLDVEEQVATAYESRRYQEAMRLLMRATDTINAHVDAAAPWAIAKDTARREELHAVCSAATRAFHLLMLMLTPVLPLLATKAGEFLNTDMHWGEKLHPLAAKHVINKYKHLMQRMDNKQLERLAQSKKTPDKSPPPTKDEPANKSPIAIEDFAKMDLRLATITAAEDVTEAQKLLKLTLDVGDTRLRQVFAGIKQHYAAETLVGRQVLYLANLKPRKMRFGESEGMVLAATDGKGDLQLLTAADMPAGAKVS